MKLVLNLVHFMVLWKWIQNLRKMYLKKIHTNIRVNDGKVKLQQKLIKGWLLTNWKLLTIFDIVVFLVIIYYFGWPNFMPPARTTTTNGDTPSKQAESCRCPSLLLRSQISHIFCLNHWTNFNQTGHKPSMRERDSNVFKWRTTFSTYGGVVFGDNWVS